MRGRASLCLVLWATVAAAEPVERPPPPLLLPDLTPTARVSWSTSEVVAVDTELQTEVAGTFAIGNLELFAKLPMRGISHLRFLDLGDDGTRSGLGNLRAGARYDLAVGRLVIAPAAWVWLPTSTVPGFDQLGLLHQQSIEDARAYGSQLGGAGFAIDAAWRTRTAFVQLEAGAALVSDDRFAGPQIDNVFFALGAGTILDSGVSLLAEWRVEDLPEVGSVQGPIVGVGWNDAGSTSYRLRAHVYETNIAFGFDIIHRFE